MADQSGSSLPHGVLIWKASAGAMKAGDPIGEPAYRTMGNPEGIRVSRLRALDPAEQAETICSWIYANYQPLPSGVGEGGFIPPGSASSSKLLGSTFGKVLAQPVLQAAVVELDEVSDLWEPTAQNSWNDARPLSRGVVWRSRRYGDAYGKPYAERVYLTPEYPNGITDSELHRLPDEEQAAIGMFWFSANYEPFILRSGFGQNFGADFGGGNSNIERWSARDILRKEFAAVFRFGARRALVADLDALSSEWKLISDRPKLIEVNVVADPRPEAVDRIDRLERIVARLVEARGGIGHNGGPALLNDGQIASVTAALEEARVGLAAGPNGRAVLEEAQDKLSKVESSLGQVWLTGFAKGSGEAAGKWLTTAVINLVPLASLWLSLHEAVKAIMHVLATMPPPPPLL